MDGQDDRFGAPGGNPPPVGGDFFGAPAPVGGSLPSPAAPPAAPPYAPSLAPPYGAPSAASYGEPAPTAYAGPAAPQFGAPVFGAPYTPTYSPPSTTSKKGPRQFIGGVVVVVFLLGAAFYGWNVWKQHQPIQVPATLGGLPALHNSTVDAVVDQGRKELDAKEPGKHATAAAFGDPASGQVVILVALRGKLISLQKDFESGGATSPLQKVGKNTCASIPNGVMCERTSAHLTEGVIAVSKTVTMTQASALLDEAWSKA